MWKQSYELTVKLLDFEVRAGPWGAEVEQAMRHMGDTPRGTATHLWRRESEQWAEDDRKTKGQQRNEMEEWGKE